ncbi:Glycosyl transferase family 2 [anaerobic digester metagenome]
MYFILKFLKSVPRAIRYFGSIRITIHKTWLCYRKDGLAGIMQKVNAMSLMEDGKFLFDYSKKKHIGNLYVNTNKNNSELELKVSVIVPCYNHEPYLRQRLDSIFGQTYNNIEVILLDDDSTDSSRMILEEYAKKYENTLCCFNDSNSGSVFQQWKRGLELASGDLVWIAESDDYCSYDMLEKLVPFFQNQAVMLAFCRSDFVSGDNSSIIWDIESYLSDLGLDIWDSSFVLSAHWLVNNAWAIKNIVPNSSSAVFRLTCDFSILDKLLSDRIKLCGDWILYLSIVRSGLVAYTPDTVNYYRQHAFNTSTSIQKTDIYYSEHEIVARYLLAWYMLHEDVILKQRDRLYFHWCASRNEQTKSDFDDLYSVDRIFDNKPVRKPNLVMAVYALSAGGGETFPLFLANILSDNEYAVSVFNFSQEPSVPGIRHMLSKKIPLFEVNNLESINYMFDDLGVEIVHSHHAWVDMTLAALLADCLITKKVITMHGMYEMMSKKQLEWVVPLLAHKVDSIVYTADKNLSVFSSNFIDENCFVKIENALCSCDIKCVNRSEMGIEDDDFVLCLVARAIPEKGWEEAIEAVVLANIFSKRRIHLLLIGSGVECDRLKPQCSYPFVHFLGFKSNIRDFFAMSDMGFLPSRFSGESYPLVIIDCLYAGRPFFASDLGHIKEMLSAEAGLAGDVFELEDWKVPVEFVSNKIVEFANNTELYSKLLSHVSGAVAKFDVSVLYEKYDSLYSKCINLECK